MTAEENPFFYELSIIFLYSGLKRTLPQCLDFLQKFEKPESTQIIFVNGWPSAGLPDAPKPYCTHYQIIPRTQESYSDWESASLAQVRPQARGKQTLVFSDLMDFPDEKRKEGPLKDYPGVSIIIPVKDSKNDLEGLLKSLRQLDYPKDKIEILVVDNNSKDGSDRAALSFPEVKLLREKKQSSYAARNLGIRRSRYDLLAFVDADCCVTVSWLKEIVEAIEEYSWIGAVAGANRPKDEKNPISRLEREFGGNLNREGTPFSPAYAITMNVLYRKQVFEELGLFDDDRISGSDSEMSWRMQFFSFWKLKILKDKGVVIHRDAVKWNDYVKRGLRIGGGMYGLHQKYPFVTSAPLYWLPLNKLELVFQFLKTFFHRNKKNLEAQKTGPPIDFCFMKVRLFLQRSGYLNAIHEEIKKKKSAGSFSSHFIFIGNKHFTPKSPEYARFQKRAESGSRVICMDPPSGSFMRSAFQFLRGLLGFTNVWHWRWGIQSMEFWNIHSSVDILLNVWRIRKNSGIKKKDPCILSGAIPWEDLKIWRRVLGEERTSLEPFHLLKDIGSLPGPVVSCVVKETPGPFELEIYQTIAGFSPWPVVIAGPMPASFYPEIQKHTIKTSNLYFYSCEGPPEEIEKLLALSGFVLPENLAMAGDCSSFIRSVQQYLHFPKWPRPQAVHKDLVAGS